MIARSLFFRRCVYNAICISPLDTLAAAAATAALKNDQPTQKARLFSLAGTRVFLERIHIHSLHSPVDFSWPDSGETIEEEEEKNL